MSTRSSNCHVTAELLKILAQKKTISEESEKITSHLNEIVPPPKKIFKWIGYKTIKPNRLKKNLK